ncbi:excalibur calcium-binding domain-containing protein [Streptomyces sp. NPDC058290]|uniref:excalibur calcium-binding domain-containing protein n=1 Tax=Streptomyces sp. NPDC058290 TaxID=3346426 RepID=UPI0036EB1D2F
MGRPCPDKAGAALAPSKAPAASRTPAGAAPMRRGQPGYREALDRDKDGVACDK